MASSEIPAFNVRSYPAFRLARLYRVYVDSDALYLIRMRGIIGIADAGRQPQFVLHPNSVLTWRLMRWWAERSQRAAASELDECGPRLMLDAHRTNMRVEPGAVQESQLRPPRLLGHGEHLACWSLTIRGRKPLTFQIEDAVSFQTALEHLPRFLGPALSVSVGWDELRSQPLRINELF